MRNTTLCYIEKDGMYLMLLRNKKKNDLNEGKWIGVGGKIEPGETPEESVRREIREETGLELQDVTLRGLVEFVSDRWEDEHMYLYTAESPDGTVAECSEGELKWIPKRDVFDLPLWEGDRAFLNYLLAEKPFFHLEVSYDEQDQLKGTRLLPNIILASASPRRFDLLSQIGITPVVLPCTAEEHMEGRTPEEIVKNLSRQKAEAVAKDFCHGEVVIGADTVVTVDGKILGKPATHEEAAEMIRLLSGRTHQVYTGVTLILCGEVQGDEVQACEKSAKGGRDVKIRRSFAAKTDVRVSRMTDAEIELYAESDEPMDKAGAYGIQGTFAAFVEGIDGEYANVVGLPLARLHRELKALLAET